jgi:xylulokinase
VSDDAVSRPAGLYVGLDLGTSSLKGVAVTAGGEVVARGHASYRTQRPGAGRAEQASSHWLRALRGVARQLSAAAAPDRWRAVGLSGMIPTLVTTGADGKPTGPAITWEDSRAEAEGAGLRNALGADELYRLTGQWVDGRYLLPMFLWLRQHDPHRAAAAAHVLGAKDYLYWWLTGEYATDPSTASGFGCYGLAAGDWLAGVSEAARVGAYGSADTARVRGGATAGRPALPAVLPSTTEQPPPASACRRDYRSVSERPTRCWACSPSA